MNNWLIQLLNALIQAGNAQQGAQQAPQQGGAFNFQSLFSGAQPQGGQSNPLAALFGGAQPYAQGGQARQMFNFSDAYNQNPFAAALRMRQQMPAWQQTTQPGAQQAWRA